MALSSSTQQREILELSFEETDSGFIYYHNRWSRGIPVTAEEREEYLRIPALGSRRAWRKVVSGRETTSPRAYGPVAWKLSRKMPLMMGLFSLIFGGVLLMSGLQEPNVPLAAAYGVAGCVLLFFGGSIIVARFRPT